MRIIPLFQSEKVKQLLTHGRYRPLAANEPLAALHRDNFAAMNPKVDEAQICSLAEQQLSSLENLVLQQRRAQVRIARVLKDAELRHRKVSCKLSCQLPTFRLILTWTNFDTFQPFLQIHF